MPRAACEELINLSVADLTVPYFEVITAFGTRSVRSGGFGSTRGETPTNLDIVPYESDPLYAEEEGGSAIEKAMADLIGDISPSRPSASHALKTSTSTGSDDDRPFVVDQAPATLNVPANACSAMLVTAGTVLFEYKYARSTRFTLLTNKLFVLATSNSTEESTSKPKSGSVGVKRSGLRKKLGIGHEWKAIRNPERIRRRGNVVLPPKR